jgi:Flp pilus assembly protein TadB
VCRKSHVIFTLYVLICALCCKIHNRTTQHRTQNVKMHNRTTQHRTQNVKIHNRTTQHRTQNVKIHNRTTQLWVLCCVVLLCVFTFWVPCCDVLLCIFTFWVLCCVVLLCVFTFYFHWPRYIFFWFTCELLPVKLLEHSSKSSSLHVERKYQNGQWRDNYVIFPQC